MTTKHNADIASELFTEDGMVWQAVESSQISEIGYESGVEYPLGIKFPAGKRSPAREYRYKNVSPELHAEFLAAESIGSFFIKNINAHPELYPYVKVESENPTDPAAVNDHPTSGGKKTETLSPSTITDGETISPSTALTVIDTMADDLLFTPGAVTDAQLAAGREWYLTEAKKYDISTEAKRTELKRFARPLQKLRTGIEARAKELTGATKRKIAAIDTEKRRLVQIVGGIEDEVLAPLTQWEQEEQQRKIRLAGIVKSLGEHVITAVYPTIASIEETIAELEAFDLSTMQEYKVSAESAIAASLKVLKPELERRKQQEAERAELERLRAEAAARAEQDRIAAAARAAKEQAEREAEIERRRLEREAQAAQERAEMAEKMRIADEQAAQRRAEEAALQAARDQEAAVAAERKRIADAAAAEQAAAEARARNKAHRLKVDNEALGAIVALDIPMDRAHDLLIAIGKGEIPHVTITY